MPNNKNKIPDRWEEYSGVGTFIAGTRFIPFKTPLKEQMLVNKAETEHFTPKELLKQVEKDGVVLGMIIDLTYTTRYYDREFFIQEGLSHYKVETEGQKVPKRDVCQRFARVVNKFLNDNWENDLFIGVHCTHGVNRTGYMICRYMIEQLNYTAAEAIKAFKDARGYRIEREEYLLHLRTLSEEIANSSDNSLQSAEQEQCQIPGRGRRRGPYPSLEERWNKLSFLPQEDFAPHSIPPSRPYFGPRRGRGPGPRPAYVPPWGTELPPPGYGEFMYRGGGRTMRRGGRIMRRGAGPFGRGVGPAGRGFRPMRGAVGPIKGPMSYRNYTEF